MSNLTSGLPACPVMPGRAQEIQLAHGGGGRMTQQLIDRVFLPAFRNRALEARHDGAVLSPPPAVRLAFTTDAHVVNPLFFRGGDIGRLAVNGTCNDLAMCGARPRSLSAGFILEEGLPIETLERVVASMARAAADNAVQIVAGDTKVVERGRADGMYITTAGMGWVEHDGEIGPGSVQAGDLVLLSGDIGRHGMAILAQREGLAFESPIESDCAPLWPAVAALLEAGIAVHCLRDLTRGGLATALIEIAETAHSSITIDETSVAVSQPVQAACEILGLDPFYVANEGRLVALVRAADADAALRVLAATAPGGPPTVIGHVGSDPPGDVTLGTRLGVPRVLDRLSGEQLPRIC